MITKRFSLAITLIGMLALLFSAPQASRAFSRQDDERQAEQSQGGILDVVQRDQEAQERALEGSWSVTVTPPAVSGAPPFLSYHTYLRGGGLIQSSSSPLEGDRPGHGTWLRTGNNEFTFIVEKFLTGNPLTNQSGVFILRIQETIKLNGDTYAGRGLGLICNSAGEQCINLGVASTSGKRLKAPTTPIQ
jgi:hypothetical protein